jgi:hypothetical protein
VGLVLASAQAVILAMLILVVAAGMVAAFSIAFLIHRLGRLNRVSPSHRSPAPLIWLLGASTPARLHRRLRTLVAVARAATLTSPAVDKLAAAIEHQAIILDDHLLVTSRLRSGRNTALRRLRRQVDELEGLAGRLAHAAIETKRRPALPGAHPNPLHEIEEQLDALDEARADLARVERAAGLYVDKSKWSLPSS